MWTRPKTLQVWLSSGNVHRVWLCLFIYLYFHHFAAICLFSANYKHWHSCKIDHCKYRLLCLGQTKASSLQLTGCWYHESFISGIMWYGIRLYLWLWCLWKEIKNVVWGEKNLWILACILCIKFSLQRSLLALPSPIRSLSQRMSDVKAQFLENVCFLLLFSGDFNATPHFLTFGWFCRISGSLTWGPNSLCCAALLVVPEGWCSYYDNIHVTPADLLHLLCLHSIPSLMLGFAQQDKTAAAAVAVAVKCALISRPAT